MTVENNWKYIAEAWIDNKEEEEFKKSFLNALIDQIQGHGKGFDADTVDGMHGEDITQAIEDATENLLSEFYIGNTYFSNSTDTLHYFLGFEAIKLYNIEADEDTASNYKQLPWSSIIYDNEEGRIIPDLYEVIEQLYNLTYFGDILTDEEIDALPESYKEMLGDKPYWNKSIYQIFLETLREQGDYIEYIKETIGTKIVNGLLNADSVNGLRFFILSEQQYADLKTKAEIFAKGEDPDYEQYENCYKKLYNIHNIFIIRTEEELIFAGYPDGRYTGNPDTVILDKYYRFRVGQAVEEGHEGKYLQYQHEDNEDLWFDMCPISDFLDRDFLESEMVYILGNNDNYVLNTEAVRKALRNITPITNNTTDIPMVNYTRETFLAGGVYDYVNSTNKKTLPIVNEGGLKYLNLTELNNERKTQTETVQTNLDAYINQISGPSGALNTIRGNITQINNNITSIKGGSNHSIKECYDKAENAETTFNTFHDEFTNKFRWKDLYETEEWINGNYQQPKDMDISIWVNEGLRLGKINIISGVYASKDNAWTNIFQIPIKKYQPIWTTYLTPHRLNLLMRITDDDGVSGTNYTGKKYPGTLQYYSTLGATSKNKKAIGVSGFFMIRGY